MHLPGVGHAHRNPVHVLAGLRDEEAPHQQAVPLPVEVQRTPASRGSTRKHARACCGRVARHALRRLALLRCLSDQRKDERKGLGPHGPVHQRHGHARGKGQGGDFEIVPVQILKCLRVDEHCQFGGDVRSGQFTCL